MSDGEATLTDLPMDDKMTTRARRKPHDWDQEKTQILASNTAQGVFKHLRALEAARLRVLPRWIWELLQNARDVSSGNAGLEASVQLRGDELTFRHNGRGFRPDEITHLIYFGSTKYEDPDALGRFGSGFLTTHLLSRTIEVSGQLTDGQSFAFELDRSGESVDELKHNMDASFEAFKSSLSPGEIGADLGTTTTFRYPIDSLASGAVREGVQALELTGPYVTAFNHEFKRIEIRTPESGVVLELQDRRELAPHIDEIEVNVSVDGITPPNRHRHVVAEFEGVAVGIPVMCRDGKMALESPTDSPKLLLGFPLIGTEDFGFPAIVHSMRFSPTEERDGVYLGQSDDPVNRENQEILEEACRRLLSLAEFAAGSGWSRIHVLAEVPRIRGKRWLNEDWLRDCLKTQLVDQVRATPLVLTESDQALAPNATTLPTADSPEAVDRLWRLSRDLTELRGTLPRQSEAQGWCNATRSWAPLYGLALGQLEGTMDGAGLARYAEAAGSIDELQAQLEDVDAVPWLDELHGFLSANGFDAELRRLKIVPNQNGGFSTLPRLRRDQDIPSELKEIAQLVGWDLRAELRDTRFSTLADESGAGTVDIDYILPSLIDRLRGRMEGDALDDDTKTASVRLFGWIAAQGRWRYLEGFPAFSDEGATSTCIKLVQHEDETTERPLAPVRTWPESLRPYADLFPRRRVLSDDFADSLDDSSRWSDLKRHGFIRTGVVYTRSARFDRFLPDEPLPEGDDGRIEHRAETRVEVTNVTFLTTRDIGVLRRVRKSRKQAQLFWDFLTRWLVANDTRGLAAQETMCVCGSPHQYYPAAWLVPLVRNQWVPLEHRRTDLVTAHSLAILLRGSGWSTDLLQSPQIAALLRALQVGVPELLKELLTTDDEQREELDKTLAKLMTSVDSDWDRLQVLAEDIREDERLFEHLEERRQRRRTVRENQRTGALVEQLVRESLEDEGFDVRRTGVGSDFEIEPRTTDEDEQIRLELTRHGRTWLVEIKSARDDSVRMTSRQVQESVEHDSNYLLCVVPIGTGPDDPDIEAVRLRMCFVGDIGKRLASICDNMDDFERFRESVTVEDTTGLRLELDSGSPRVRIDRAVWEAGFHLDCLFSRLTEETAPIRDANSGTVGP